MISDHIIFLVRKAIFVKNFGHYSFFIYLKEFFLYPYDLYIRRGKSSSLRSVDLFITDNCNLKCNMCNVVNKGIIPNKDPSLNLLKTRIDKLKSYRPNITLFGGEPLMRQDISQIIQHIKKNKMNCGFYTNAGLLTKEALETLDKAGIDWIVISLHGDEDIHDLITQKKGTYTKIIKCLELIKNYKGRIKFSMNCCITDNNLNKLDHIVRISKKYNLPHLSFSHLTFNTKNEKKDQALWNKFHFPNLNKYPYMFVPFSALETSDVVLKVKNFLDQNKKLYNFSPSLSVNEVETWYHQDFKSQRKCSTASYRGVCILTSGEVTTCESLGLSMGNIDNKNFKIG